jgi:rubrerythrin
MVKKMKFGVIVLRCHKCGYEDYLKTDGVCPMCENEMKLEFKESEEKYREIRKSLQG